MTAPRLNFGLLQGFPSEFEDDKIDTEKFLVASLEVIKILESFGKIYKPVVLDMQGNHNKIKAYYECHGSAVQYLEDLILYDVQNTQRSVILSVLWLKRALELIVLFFAYILDDQKSQAEDLKVYLSKAYAESLQPFHGYLLQKTFRLSFHLLPTRSCLLGTDDVYNENMKHLEFFVPNARMHIERISQFYEQYQLNDMSKV